MPPFNLSGTSISVKKKEPKPKLFGPHVFGWGGGLPREGVGAKKFGMSFETQGSQTFWRDIPGFCRELPGGRPKNSEVSKRGWREGVGDQQRPKTAIIVPVGDQQRPKTAINYNCPRE